MKDFVNSRQSKIERSVKYLLLREVGLTVPQAQRFRDFDYCSLKKRLQIILNGNTNTFGKPDNYIQ